MTSNSELQTTIRQLGADDLDLLRAMLNMFGEAFGETDIYCDAQPDDDYLRKQLCGEYFIAVAAIKEQQVVGGIAAYELPKFEQERSEIYIYDLAVAAEHRRAGIATAMIEKMRSISTRNITHQIMRSWWLPVMLRLQRCAA